MDIYLKDKNVIFHTAKKYCEEDINVNIECDKISAIPSAEEQTYSGIFDEVKIAGDSNLVPENIPEGKEIFEVKGTAKIADQELVNSYIACVDNGDGSNITKLPEGLTSIGGYAFYKRTNLALTKLPETVTSIGEYGFYACTNLALTELPKNITSIEQYTFFMCTNIKLTELPDNITYIGTYAFNGCGNFNLTKLPLNLKDLDASAFRNCSKLAITELPEGLQTIGSAAFIGCNRLNITKIPESVTSIGSSAFQSTAIKTLELPESITKIESQTFYYSDLISLTVKGKITNIATQSFYNSDLDTLILSNITEVPTLANKNAFTNTPIANGTGYVYVPDNLVESFKTATNWSTYADQIKPISELEVT